MALIISVLRSRQIFAYLRPTVNNFIPTVFLRVKKRLFIYTFLSIN
jgi:hypothetical protein